MRELGLEQWRRFWKQRGKRELRDLIWLWWDPINLYSDHDSPLDEYDTHVERLGARLYEGADAGNLASFLGDCRESILGEADDPEADRVAAEKALEWYEQAMARLTSRL